LGAKLKERTLARGKRTPPILTPRGPDTRTLVGIMNLFVGRLELMW
jgi:hypothetical protein